MTVCGKCREPLESYTYQLSEVFSTGDEGNPPAEIEVELCLKCKIAYVSGLEGYRLR